MTLSDHDSPLRFSSTSRCKTDLRIGEIEQDEDYHLEEDSYFTVTQQTIADSVVQLVNNKGKAVLQAKTQMGRALLIAEFFINVTYKNWNRKDINTQLPQIVEKLYPVYVVTSQFESSDIRLNIENRHKQIKDTLNVIFKKEPNCIIAGDFNFDN